MPDPRTLFLPVASISLLLYTACAPRTPTAQMPQPGARLTRAAELPVGSPTPSGGAAATFGQACAMRLLDQASGREFLLVHSDVRTSTSRQGDATETALASAVGDYALVSGDGRGGPPVPTLRVDCTTSRVVSLLTDD